MSGFRTRTVAVEVNEASAFITNMAALAEIRKLPALRTREGPKNPNAATVAAAERFIRDRQLMSTRLRIRSDNEGSIIVDILEGHVDGHGAASVVIANGGKPTIRAGEEETEHQSISSAAFRKALDRIVSPRPNRYGLIKRIEVDGIVFHSPQEAKRYVMLKADERMGLISDLKLQVPFRFEEGGRHCFTYLADMTYVVTATGQLIVEDVKGMPTDVYKLKKKLIEARFGIAISEWPVPKKEIERRAREEVRRAAAEAKDKRKAERAEAKRIKDAEKAEKERQRAEKKVAAPRPESETRKSA